MTQLKNNLNDIQQKDILLSKGYSRQQQSRTLYKKDIHTDARDGNMKYCLLAALDVNITFISVPWNNICLALDKLNVPACLRILIMSCSMAVSLFTRLKREINITESQEEQGKCGILRHVPVNHSHLKIGRKKIFWYFC